MDDENRLNVFEMSCLRRILGVSRLDKIRNSHIKQSLNLETSATDRVSTKRLKYFGHVTRMRPHRNPKIALEGQVQGNRPRGRPPKKWLDCLSKDCEGRSIQSLYQAGRLPWTEKPGSIYSCRSHHRVIHRCGRLRSRSRWLDLE